MILNVLVTEKVNGKDFNPYGYFDFSVLPRIGERIVLGKYGGLHILEVINVEHSPVMTEPDTKVAKFAKEEEGPKITLFVRLVDTVF
jgi:hypothetical protein